MLVGTNPRLEAAVLNARIGKRWRSGGATIGLIGEAADLGYGYDHLGTGPETLASLASGDHPFFDTLKKAERPMVIVGAGASARADGSGVLSLAAQVAFQAAGGKNPKWRVFNVLHSAASRSAGLDLEFVPSKGGRDVTAMLEAAGMGQLDVLYLLGADELDFSRLGSTFVIYQGSHGDAGAQRADVILPSAAYTEKSATYVNTEGRSQQTVQAIFPPGEAKEDWKIIRALSAELGQVLGYDTLEQLRAQLYEAHPHLALRDQVKLTSLDDVAALAQQGGEVTSLPLLSSIGDFYLTNPIARSSRIMAELSALKSAAHDHRAPSAA